VQAATAPGEHAALLELEQDRDESVANVEDE
jgi:hypothetical protein